MASDPAGNIYVVEEAGYRLLGFDPGGIIALSVGQPGQPWPNDDLLPFPKDVARDSAGNLWVVVDHGLKQFDSQGNPLQTLPSFNLGQPGSSNTRFRSPQGAAFDAIGRLFVSDTANHRIQVYGFTNGTPTFSTTIGQTGISGSDNGHFNYPGQVAIDGSGRLYVVDTDNFRVQRCTESNGNWTCTTFHGTGSPGSGANQLNFPSGVGLDSGDNVYIADTDNGRVKRCTPGGSCADFVSGLGKPADVLVSSDGTILISDLETFTIGRYNSSGSPLDPFAGTPGAPYVSDPGFFNSPSGVAVGPDGSVFTAESRGYRIIKQDATGQPLWSAGEAGVHGSDNSHFGDFWSGPEGNPGVDRFGKVYVTDTSNHRIQVFAADGTFQRSVGERGAGDNQFDCPSGVAINPLNDSIVVADKCNHRIQIFDSAWNYLRTLGETGQAGSDARHFRFPSGVAADDEGAIYVADTNNRRVQKCILAPDDYACVTWAGETGIFGDDFGLLNPVAVAVDRAGQLYALDLWNNRVQVFDDQGAYLTTIGGIAGSTSGSLRNPSGVAVGPSGHVYVSDRDNHRVLKFIPAIPGWTQKNINGFGERWNTGVSALEVFGGQLYAGASNWEDGGRIWRSSDGSTWTTASPLGFGSAHVEANPAIIDLTVFDGQLYAGTGWGNAGGQSWRTSNGTDWEQVIANGFDNSNNEAITALTGFAGQLYAATNNSLSGAEIWRSPSGNSDSWTLVAGSGFGQSPNNDVISSLAVIGEYLYAAVENKVQGAQVWRSRDGSGWTQVASNGFGQSANRRIGTIVSFQGWVYASTSNETTGGQIWRSPDGSLWLPAVTDGFGDINNSAIESLFVWDSDLFAVTNNPISGLEVWRSSSGSDWRQVNPDGMGDSNNDATLWANATTAFANTLHLGTWNWANGGELWRYLPRPLYLPLVVR
jgi:sugar lactone lactonase YvrE